MSLAQHVTQNEGLDYDDRINTRFDDLLGREQGDRPRQLRADVEPGADAISPIWHRLSYSPIHLARDKPRPRDAAYKVSKVKRCTQVAVGVVACWLASGIVFGFAALKPILISEGVFRRLCRDDDNEDTETKCSGQGHRALSPVPSCARQDMRLNLFFLVASIAGNTTCLLAGATLDRFGRRPCWIISSVLLGLASLLMATSFSFPAFDGYIASNIVFAIGGTYLFVSSFELANTFPKHSGIIVAFITGSFDASAAVFFFYLLAYEASHRRFSPAKFFYGYLIVPFLILVAEIFLMPANGYHTMPELEAKILKAQDHTRDLHDSDVDISDADELTLVRSARVGNRMAKLGRLEDVVGDTQERESRVRRKTERHKVSGVRGVLHGLPFRQQIRSLWYVFILLLTAVQMFRMNYFIATIRSQYSYRLNSDGAADSINHFFDAALPVGGAVATPIIGLLLNNRSVTSVCGTLTFLIATAGVLDCLPFVWAGYAAVVVFVLFRPLYYSAVSDYVVKVFGFAAFGRIYGTIICVSGLTNFLQSGLDGLLHGPLGGNPVPVNSAFGIAGTVVGLALTVFVSIRGREFIQERADGETNQERRRLAGGDGAWYGTGP